MGRWFLILVASIFTVGMIAAFLPGTRQVAFHVLGGGVPWIGLIGGCVVFGYHRISAKG